MSINLDRRINHIENKLSEISRYPVVGTIAGCAKIAIGVTQTITAVACGILLLLPSAIRKDASLLKYCWCHFKHGLGNMFGGFVEAIPVIQTLVYRLREDIETNIYCESGLERAFILTRHENKFMPYDSLVENDWYFIATFSRDLKSIEEVYFRKISENGGPEKTSSSRRFQLAKETLQELNLHY